MEGLLRPRSLGLVASFASSSNLGSSSTVVPAEHERLRYLDVEKSRGDIEKAYLPTVDPAKAEASRRMATLAAGARATSRPPFAERWSKHGAPGSGSVFIPVNPAVVDRLPNAEVLDGPVLDVEVPPSCLLPTGTDLDDDPAARVHRVLDALCAAHFAHHAVGFSIPLKSSSSSIMQAKPIIFQALRHRTGSTCGNS